MPGIEPVIPGHLEMLFRDVLDQKLNKIQDGKGPLDIGIILVPVVMEGDVLPIIGIDARGGNNRASQITADVSDNGVGLAEVRLGIDVKAVLILFINKGLRFFKGRPDTFFHLVQEGRLKGLSEIGIAEVLHDTPEAIIGESAFRQEAVDMRVPFQGASESMKDTDKARNKVPALVELVEHFQDNAADGLEQTVKKRTVFKEERAEPFVNGKDEVAVGAPDQLERHPGGTLNGIFIAAGRAELGVAAEGNKFQFATMRASIHGAAIGGIPAINHFFNILYDDVTRM